MPVSTEAPSTNARHADLSAPEQGVKHSSIGGAYLRQGGLRLDGSFYSEEAWLARVLVQETGYDEMPVGGDDGLADVWMPGRFKRVEASDPQLGVPFVTPSEIIQAKPPLTRYLSKARTSNLETYLVDSGWILVSRSGVVGRVVMVSETLQGTAVSEDAIRVVARGGVPPGYVYAYLTSFIGSNLITKDQYGAVIKHIEPFHVARVPVPLLPPSLQHSIHDDIIEAYRLRDEANDLLDEADALLHDELGLPRLDESEVRYYGGGTVKAFTTKLSETGLRLDGTFSDPMARLAIENVRRSGMSVRQLNELTSVLFNPPIFKRMRVRQPDYGVRYFTGAEIMHLKPSAEKYLSRTMPNIHHYVVQKNWVLVTDSGTIGNVQFVDRWLAGSAVTNNVIRVCSERLHPGYLYAFLVSPYGNRQIVRCSYGAVIQHIEPHHVGRVLIPEPEMPAQEAIGDKVLRAYDNRAKANELENRAIRLLEDTLVEAYQKRTGRKVAIA
ncbi:MAG TPA: restriction endonuclease subunit S [Anaerolineae bacterium]|nr:restriction endonuclease subunit S [Anaerolineae bacterium]